MGLPVVFHLSRSGGTTVNGVFDAIGLLAVAIHTDFGVFDKLKVNKPYGSAEPPADKSDDPYQLGLRTEHLLTVTNTQRSNHIARLASRNDVRAQTPHALVFTSADMKDTMNAWRKQPDMWSNSLQTIQNLQTTQECHLDVKSKFNTMLFQLFGCKPLVDICIRFPICCAEQPAPLLKHFAHAWRSFRNSPEANSARKKFPTEYAMQS